jgi:hypothetical protein
VLCCDGGGGGLRYLCKELRNVRKERRKEGESFIRYVIKKAKSAASRLIVSPRSHNQVEQSRNR